MTFFRREGENPMKHFGSYLTIAGTVPYCAENDLARHKMIDNGEKPYQHDFLNEKFM